MRDAFLRRNEFHRAGRRRRKEQALRIVCRDQPLKHRQVLVVVDGRRRVRRAHELVAAAPRRERDVAAAAEQRGDRRPAQQIQKRRKLRRNVIDAGARLDELLPHENPVPIAQLVEDRLLDNAAPPNPRHVDVGLLHEVHLPSVGRFRDVAVYVVERRQVYAANVDRSPVHHERVRQCVRRRILVPAVRQRADADAERPFVKLPVPRHQPRRDRIQRLFPVSVRPPKPRIRHRQRAIVFGDVGGKPQLALRRDAPVRVQTREPERQSRSRARFGSEPLHPTVQPHGAYVRDDVRVGGDGGVPQRRFVVQAQLDAVPQPDIDEARREVPLVIEPALLRTRHRRLADLPHLVGRALHDDAQLERFPRSGPANHRRDVENRGLVHMPVFAEQRAVQINHRFVIDAQKHEFRPGEIPGRTREGRLIDPPSIFDPLAFQAVRLVVRILDPAGSEQVDMDAARHAGRHPIGHPDQLLPGFHAAVFDRHPRPVAANLPIEVG